MHQQEFGPWDAHRETPFRVDIESLRDEADGLIVHLRAADGTARLKVSFDQVVAYRCIDESYRHRTWRSLHEQQRRSMLIVEHSRWVEWLRAKSDGVLDECELTHFAIFTQDDCIDVVTKVAPNVEVIG